MTINATCTERACRWLVIVSLLLCSISAKAAYEKIDGVWINITSETNLTAEVVYDPSGYSGNIIIPETIVRLGKTYRVTSIASSAFDGDVDVTSVFIPESVTSIGDYAFRNCSGMRTINFPSKCSAGLYTFQGCTGELTVSRNLPSVEVNTNPKIFGYFYGSRFTSVKVDDNVTSVGPSAFWNCNTIQSVILSETVTAIGGKAFYGCSSLASITIPDGVTSIGGSAFEDCSGLTSITSMAVVPPTIGNAYTFYNVDKSIPVYVPAASLDDYKAAEYWKEFTNILPIETDIASGICGDHLTWKLTEEGELIIEGYGDMYDYSWESTNKAPWSEYEIKKVTIETGATSIGDYAFMILGTNDISLPESLVRIGEGAFYACEYIERFTIPNGVESVGSYAFEGCFNMTDIHIPASLKKIGNNAFTECEELRRVHITNVEAWCEIEYGTALSHPFAASASRYGSILFMDYNVVRDLFIPKTVTYINRFAFYNIDQFNSITCEAVVPPTIEGPYAFDKTDKSIPVYVPAASLDDYKAAEYWKDFFNILPIKRETSIVDGEDFEHDQDELFDEITYTRTFNNTHWQALYVPFEIPVTAEFLADFEVAYINNVHQRDYDDDGVTEQTEVEAFKITKGTLRANYPYLIRAKEAGKKIITVTNTTLYATEENSIDCASVFITYTFTGTYKRLESDVLPQSEGYYALSGGKWKPIAAGSSLGAFRFYLQVKSRGGDAATKALSIRMRIFDEYGNEEITEVEDIEANLPAEDVVYDLQGRRVEVPGKGVYIVNGKKTVF